MAAQNVYLAIVSAGSPGGGASDRQRVESRGSSEVSWVSKLKERYEKLGKPGVGSDYKVKESDGGFVSRIFIPELGREVEGGRAKSKKEAKQNAAKKALNLLPK